MLRDVRSGETKEKKLKVNVNKIGQLEDKSMKGGNKFKSVFSSRICLFLIVQAAK